MRTRYLTIAGFAVLALTAAACGSSSSSSSSSAPTSSSSSASPSASSGSSSGQLKTTTIKGVTVLTNSAGRTLYSFMPDTSTKSNCNGTCAAVWPPVKGPATAGQGVTGKLGTITRSDGSVQATYNGHPLYTYTGDTAAGQNTGNGLNANGGVWHEVTASGAAPAPGSSSSKSGY